MLVVDREEKMESTKMLQEALDIFTEKHEANGDDYTKARLLAYAGVFGVIAYTVSDSQAKMALDVAKKYSL